MKTSPIVLSRLLSAGALSVICLLALPLTAEARNPPPFSQSRVSKNQHSDHRGNDDRGRQAYSSHPRSSFTLSFGTGYAGSGYYYGPPNSPYYYQRSDVRYYATRNLVPREYYRNDGYQGRSVGASVQRELARRGFYRGYVDGRIGPQTQRAIYRYQQSRGLRPTGTITSSLLRSLGLQ